jgi:hypothetical protein
MAQRGEIELIDATAPTFPVRHAIPPCAHGTWPDCQFLDLTHYRHSMGRAIAQIVAAKPKP